MATRYLQNGYMDRVLKPRPSIYDIAKMEWPEGYGGMYHPDDWIADYPIKCMRTNPNIMTIVPIACKPNQKWVQFYGEVPTTLTNPYSIAWDDPVPTSCMKTNPGFTGMVTADCKPNKAEIARRAELLASGKGMDYTLPVFELTDRNGETVPIVVNGEQENLAPLIMLAGLAALLFMGG